MSQLYLLQYFKKSKEIKVNREKRKELIEREREHMEEETSAAKNASKKKMIMVAIDDSEQSFYALNWTLDYLLNNPSNNITLINVQLPFSPMVYPAGPAPTLVEAVKKAQHEDATRILSQALYLCEQKMVKAETLILEGDPKDKICQAAHELHVDLLVVGSRGLGKIKRAFLGSVSDYCAHHVHCPILIVKPSKEDPKSS